MRYLAGKNALLVLDNFEQLTGWANILADLLAAAEGVKLLVTSRERLNLPGEWVLELNGLSFPSQEGLNPSRNMPLCSCSSTAPRGPAVFR